MDIAPFFSKKKRSLKGVEKKRHFQSLKAQQKKKNLHTQNKRLAVCALFT